MALWISLAAPVAYAGLGPENVAVVINSDSVASMAVANEFIHLRQIPPTNVVYLQLGQPTDPETIDVGRFRGQILKPVLRTLAERGLAGQIDCIAYSADIPYAVRVASDFRDIKLPKIATRTGSINGLTYLYPFVLAKSAGYLSMTSNRYARRPMTRLEDDLKDASARGGPIAPTRGFRSLYAWSSRGQRVETGRGPQYLLSIMLAVTGGRGTTVAEALAYLRRSAAADGTRPTGTVYYMVNGDVRTRTRQWGYAAAIDSLKAVGVNAELRHGTVPIARQDVMGVMTGAATFDWDAGGSRISPGAICEHLTSTGGVMKTKGNQTPLSEFLRRGAAGASGTVTEPYAIAAKFPSPFMHYHYARGLTLIEAFYQSILGPYQLLIVGDPLCRPWALIPTVTVDGLAPGDQVTDDLRLTAHVADGPAAITVNGFEVFLDGRRLGTCGPDGKFVVPTESMAEGYHELRIVAVTGGDLETRGLRIVPFHRVGTGGVLLAEPASDAPLALGAPLLLRAELEGADRIDFHHNGRLLASIIGARGQVMIDSRQLGPGTVKLLPTGSIRGEDQQTRTVHGRPITVHIVDTGDGAPTTQGR